MGIASTYKILLSLKTMFGDKGRPVRQATLRTMMNTRMTKGIPVIDHMIHMIELFHKTKILKDKINGKTQVNIILETLLESFKQFKAQLYYGYINDEFAKPNKGTLDVKGILKYPKGVHMLVKDSSDFSRNKKKYNSFKKSKQRKNKAGKGKSKAKGKCFVCGKNGH